MHQIFAFEPEFVVDWEVKDKWNELVPLNVLMMISDGIFEFNPDLNVTKIIDYDTYEGQIKQARQSSGLTKTVKHGIGRFYLYGGSLYEGEYFEDV